MKTCESCNFCKHISWKEPHTKMGCEYMSNEEVFLCMRFPPIGRCNKLPRGDKIKNLKGVKKDDLVRYSFYPNVLGFTVGCGEYVEKDKK